MGKVFVCLRFRFIISYYLQYFVQNSLIFDSNYKRQCSFEYLRTFYVSLFIKICSFSQIFHFFSKNNCLDFIVRGLMKYSFCSFLTIIKKVLFPLLSLCQREFLVHSVKKKSCDKLFKSFHVTISHTQQLSDHISLTKDEKVRLLCFHR